LYLLMGPFLYFYIRGVFSDRFIFNKIDLLHAVPALLHFVSIINYLMLPFHEKETIIAYCNLHHNALDNFPFNTFFTLKTNYIIRLTSLFGYLLFCFLYITREAINFKNEIQTVRSKYIFRWLYVLLFLLLLIISSYSYFLLQYLKASSYLYSLNAKYVLSLSVLGIALINTSLMMFPEILYGKLRLKPTPKIYKKSLELNILKLEVAENEYFIDLTNQIKDYFNKKQPYLNPEFSISDLTIALKVPQHHIMICYRDYIGIRFTGMKINYRVEHSKKELLNDDNKKLTIEAIGLESGFLSKSNFFSCFKKHTGTTPFDYQKNNLNRIV
jgi:AraC-like DNA-binding protein